MKVFFEAPKYPDEEETFNRSVDELVKVSCPSHEGQHPLLKQFGTRTGGICDTWLYTNNWRDLPELDKWKYVALCALYWKKMYEYWLDREEFKRYLEHLKEHGETDRYEALKKSEKDEEERIFQVYKERNTRAK